MLWSDNNTFCVQKQNKNNENEKKPLPCQYPTQLVQWTQCRASVFMSERWFIICQHCLREQHDVCVLMYCIISGTYWNCYGHARLSLHSPLNRLLSCSTSLCCSACLFPALIPLCLLHLSNDLLRLHAWNLWNKITCILTMLIKRCALHPVSPLSSPFSTYKEKKRKLSTSIHSKTVYVPFIHLNCAILPSVQ